jgi:ABC-type transport system involved in cytochrome bd biosynthesis fused ATPase/permease subunit
MSPLDIVRAWKDPEYRQSLLDEATSHLDVMTEELVDRQLSEIMSTRIAIAHRLSTVRNADLILMLDQGRIVEQGSHEELLALGGLYSELTRSQREGWQADSRRLVPNVYSGRDTAGRTKPEIETQIDYRRETGAVLSSNWAR